MKNCAAFSERPACRVAEPFGEAKHAKTNEECPARRLRGRRSGGVGLKMRGQARCKRERLSSRAIDCHACNVLVVLKLPR